MQTLQTATKYYFLFASVYGFIFLKTTKLKIQIFSTELRQQLRLQRKVWSLN